MANSSGTLVPLARRVVEWSLSSLEDDVDLQLLEGERVALTLRLAEIHNSTRRIMLQRARMINKSSRIARIPPELLSLIFEWGKASIDETFCDNPDDHKNIHNLPFELVVSHVSMHFRDVAVGTHRLWTSIRVAPGNHFDKLSTYIVRSANCTLDMRVYLSGCGHNPGGLRREVLELILPTSHRWVRLSVTSPKEATDFPMILKLCNQDAPVLEYLSVCIEGVERIDPNAVNVSPMHPSILSNGASKLSFLRLRGLAMHLLRPPLASVNTLHLDQTKLLPMSYSTFREILTTPLSLEHLSIYGDILGTEIWPTTSSIKLPALSSLRLCGVGGEIYSGILLLIDAPLLESLVLKDVQEHDLDGFWDSGDSLSKFPRLQSVTFCDFDVSDFTYQRMFSAFPAVRSFTSFNCSASRSPLPRLLVEEQWEAVRGIPWPKLHTVSFLSDCDETESVLVDVVERRKRSGYPLGKLRLGTCYEGITQRQNEDLSLQDAIVVEWFWNIDRWPASNEYPDQDDMLFT